jgi:hypothetical protein
VRNRDTSQTTNVNRFHYAPRDGQFVTRPANKIGHPAFAGWPIRVGLLPHVVNPAISRGGRNGRSDADCRGSDSTHRESSTDDRRNNDRHTIRSR